MAADQPTIHYASASGPEGAVYRGPECTYAETVTWRSLGHDVVVCGDGERRNRRHAQLIEEAVSGIGNVIRHRPHVRSAGPEALPRFQPSARPPEGHAFYETREMKAKP